MADCSASHSAYGLQCGSQSAYSQVCSVALSQSIVCSVALSLQCGSHSAYSLQYGSRLLAPIHPVSILLVSPAAVEELNVGADVEAV